MISKFFANKVLNSICGVSNDLSHPSKVYLGLCKNAPNGDKGVITGEPTVASYKRVMVSGSSKSPKLFGEAAGGIIQNTEEIMFKPIRQEIGQVNYFFLSTYESADDVPLSGTNALADAFLWGELHSKDEDGNEVDGVFIKAETVPVFYIGDLKASIDVPLT